MRGGMNFNEYQELIKKTWGYPNAGKNLIYPALGLVGESGEAVDKIKKWWRNHGAVSAEQLTLEQRDALILEIGDVLWYIAALAIELDIPLSYIAEKNIEKTHGRLARGTVKGEGDNR